VSAAVRANHAIARGRLIDAQTELFAATRLFPFIKETLHLLLRLSIEVGRFGDAVQALAWLSPLLKEEERNAAQKMITSATRAYNAVLEGDCSASVDAPYAIISHMTSLLRDENGIREEAPASNTRASFLYRGRLLVYLMLVILALIAGTSVISLIRFRHERETLAIAVASCENAAVEWNTTRDSLAVEIRLAKTAKDSIAESIRTSYISLDETAERTGLLVRLGPHATYRMLNLASEQDSMRIPSMEFFVTMYPHSECYTGPFLRELFDHYDVLGDARAAAVAMQLDDYCSRHPGISYLRSQRVIEVLSGGIYNDQP